MRRPGTGPLPAAFGGPDRQETADSGLRFKTRADAEAWRAGQGLPPSVPVMTTAEVHQYVNTGEHPEACRTRRAAWDAEHGPYVPPAWHAAILDGIS